MIVVLQGGTEQLERVFTKEYVDKAVWMYRTMIDDTPKFQNSGVSNTIDGNTTDQIIGIHVNASIVETKDGGNNTNINANVNINGQIN